MANKTVTQRIEWMTDSFKIIGQVKDNTLIEVEIICLKNPDGRGTNVLTLKSTSSILTRHNGLNQVAVISIFPLLKELAEQLHIVIEDIKNDKII